MRRGFEGVANLTSKIQGFLVRNSGRRAFELSLYVWNNRETKRRNFKPEKRDLDRLRDGDEPCDSRTRA